MDNGDGRPQRKRAHIKARDYRQNGAYFLTTVTRRRHELFGAINGQRIELSEIGQIVEACITQIPKIYPSVRLDEYVVMPNHVHLLLIMLDEKNNPSIQRVMQQLKGAVSKQASFTLWQEGFHDHLVLSEEEFSFIKQYIHNNARNWQEDRYSIHAQ